LKFCTKECYISSNFFKQIAIHKNKN
jgi:hypothetical protein